MRSADHLMRPWLEHLLDHVGGADLFDAHAHIGANDPDGFRQAPEEKRAPLSDLHVLTCALAIARTPGVPGG